MLCDAPALLGERAAALEPTGSRSLSFDHHSDEQLGGYWGVDPEERADARPAEGQVARAYRLRGRWGGEPREHRQTHLAHYIGTSRAPSTVVSRFGLLAGVVVVQFEARFWRKADKTYARPLDAAQDALEQVLADLEPHEQAIRGLDRQLEHDRQSGYILTRAERHSLKVARAAALKESQPLRTKQSGLLAAVAELHVQRRSGDPLDALVALCRDANQTDQWDPAKRDQPTLWTRAEKAVRAAHRHWWRGETEESALAIAERILDLEAS